MLREWIITIYLLFFKIFFEISKWFPLKNKTVMVISFPGNIPLIKEELDRQLPNENIVIIQTNKSSIPIDLNKNTKVLNLHHPFQYFQSIYYLATSHYVFVDNYYGFLAVTNFKEDVKCIQVWHAVGAMKLFGLNDLSNETRTKNAIDRFNSVYNRFDYIVVGSKKMERIFKESFNVQDNRRFLRTGIPRTDFFFNDLKKRSALQQFNKDFPLSSDNKVILYAPTYREDQLGNSKIKLALNLDEMYKKLKSSHILLLRLHPAIHHQFMNEYPGFIYNVSDYESINTLLVGTDVLITDYSSIPFEYALLNKPMIFYAYDLEQYAKERGIIASYTEEVPGPIVKTTTEVIQLIKENTFDLTVVKQFAAEWNEFSNGNSTKKLIQALYPLREEEIEQIREHV